MSKTLDLLGLLKVAGGEGQSGAVAGPNPTELASPIADGDVGEQRGLFCAEYDACLDIAVRRGWPSWACIWCPLAALAKVLQAKWVDREAALRPDA